MSRVGGYREALAELAEAVFEARHKAVAAHGVIVMAQTDWEKVQAVLEKLGRWLKWVI